jgi:mannosyltransferase
VPIENNLASDLQLIVPNLHRRYSGVTATNRMVAPKLARCIARHGSGRMRPTASRGWVLRIS